MPTEPPASPSEDTPKPTRKPRARKKPVPEPPSDPLLRAFPTVVRYMGLLVAMYEAILDRPPQALVIGLAATMMAGAQVGDSIVKTLGKK